MTRSFLNTVVEYSGVLLWVHVPLVAGRPPDLIPGTAFYVIQTLIKAAVECDGCCIFYHVLTVLEGAMEGYRVD